ncbi:hypothetical protein POM88_036407 [Heracleum sosnowskyi]|uniref:RNase H type-1 domain-containing protein n=1 Tax=Heracleum sosnowskyi TaxID=360622 RepID=A0AAD8HQK6_9APIA|nr:hypothetical protein POM88_036407 [Heracleum sosnowskyi]
MPNDLVITSSSQAQLKFSSLLVSSFVDSHSPIINYPLQWTPPSTLLVKYNCDGAFNRHSAIIGIIGRNSDGFMVDGSSSCVNAASSLQTKLIAIRETCFIINRRFLHAIVESDCKMAIDLLTYEMIPPSDCAIIVEDIKVIGSDLSIYFSCAPWSYNKAVLCC